MRRISPVQWMYFISLLVLWLILAEFGPWSEWIIGAFASFWVLIWLRESLITMQAFSGMNRKRITHFIPFLFSWLWDLLKANIEVAKIVLSKNMNIDPQFYTLKQPLKSEINQAILANAITLTPGTLTVDYDDATLTVHGLRSHHIDDLKSSPFLSHLKATEKRGE